MSRRERSKDHIPSLNLEVWLVAAFVLVYSAAILLLMWSM